ncbi:MAG: HAD-IA family hydrolase [Chloroflexi bacterium]|uniref:HAD-IA family hydrolase n=1 Tax=Candidatus Chlorohelix allophototropha TaxID=3003348 RepID=A0A8T7M7A3_9CHLR|nr:HAD-IA family hydrolase [Chloroflexota bacterium]WJW69929.1 HAD-IA family hydrolase [Chloroflexota bacterium L227-S17]
MSLTPEFKVGSQRYDVVFFDIGSTLVGVTPSFTKVYHQVFQRAGYDLPIGEVEEAVSYSWDIVAKQDPHAEFERSLEGNRLWQRAVEQRVMDKLNIHPDIHEELFWQIIEAFENPETYMLYPDVMETLQRLEETGYRMGIISNWSWHLPELLEHLGIARYFKYIGASARVGYAKPRREFFEIALHNLDVTPDKAIHIGDSYTADILGAWSVGMAALWLERQGQALRFAPPGDPNNQANKIKIENLDSMWKYLEHGVSVVAPGFGNKQADAE